jgi:6-phosphogluconolactonase (cycloisomerase 2 family)
MSPDGRNVYAAAEGSAALAVMARVARTGALRQLPGALGCVSAAGAEGCARGRNLAVARAVAVSRDGRTVYVATAGGLAVFARSPRDGALRQLAGRAGCVSESGSDGCARARAVSKARGVALGPEGRSLYLVGLDDALAVFRRNRTTGVLTQLTGARGCVKQHDQQREGCTAGRGLRGTRDVAIARHGRDLYVASLYSAVATFRRDPHTGAARQLRGRAGCIAPAGRDGCARGRGLAGPHSIALGPHERHVYVTVSMAIARSSGIAVFRRDAGTGRLRQLAGRHGCLNGDGSAGCAPARSVRGAHSLVLDPIGDRAYVASEFPTGTVAVFRRGRRTGSLRQLRGRRGCLVAEGSERCARVRALRGAHQLVLSPDGRHLYVAVLKGNGVVTLRRQLG